MNSVHIVLHLDGDGDVTGGGWSYTRDEQLQATEAWPAFVDAPLTLKEGAERLVELFQTRAGAQTRAF